MKLLLFLFFVLFATTTHSQELQGKITVVANQISTQVDKKLFLTLQAALNNFINSRKWTNDVFQSQEKIKCNFLLNVDAYLGNNVFKGSLTVQAARPVYNTTYDSPMINFRDGDFTFKYVEFQPIEFNENRIQGNDPLGANITAMLAYYCYLILGIDYDSFAPKGGDIYFQKAQYIVNNAPEASEINGWKTFDGLRNRFKLIEGLVDSRYNLVHDAIYAYYRSGLDHFYDNEAEARTGILNALNYMNTINSDNPNSMILQFFFQGKSGEFIRIFSKAEPELKSRARDLLTRLDLTNINAYKELK
ncbi:MAG: DUF4835 family protein [Flavisolibacter sp.]